MTRRPPSSPLFPSTPLFQSPWVRRVKDGGRMQAFLHATLDDASRLIPHAKFYASQGLDASLDRSEEHTSELQSQSNFGCRLLPEKKKNMNALTSGSSISIAL